MRILLRAAPLLVLGALLAASAGAWAHNHVCIEADGKNLDRGGHGRPGVTGATGDCAATDKLEFIVGWREEPPFAGEKNGLDLGVRFPGNKTVVGGITTLNAQYEMGGKTFPVQLRPQFGRDGWYTDDIMPTRPGTYTLRVWGTVPVNGTNVAINFTTHPATVDPPGDIAFPDALQDTAALEQRIAALEGKVQALQQGTPSKGGVTVEPKRTPGAEPLLALGVLGIAALAARRRYP